MNHQYNPRSTKFLNAKMSGWTNQPGPGFGGVDNYLNYRDPWGNPYFITLDLNFDDQCQDAVYCKQGVSWTGSGALGFNGLSNPSMAAGGSASDAFMFHGKVMVWSAGPDGKVDITSSSAHANQGVNKDNILSWH
jgi:hypothetical protein